MQVVARAAAFQIPIMLAERIDALAANLLEP